MPPSLPKAIQNKPFTYPEAKSHGVSRNDIQRLLKSGKIERISRGVYRAPADDLNEEEQFRIATLRIGKDSAVCLLSALAFYGLTDAIPRAVWLLVSTEKHTRFSGVRLLRKRSPRLDVGIVVEDGYKITSLERTIAESLAEGKRIGINTGVQALRKAVSRKRTSLKKVTDSAIELGILKKILPYIEALS